MAKRIVIVDDHVLLRDTLTLFLEKNGFHVVGIAGDGAQAFDVIRNARPDLILMDISLPFMNGIELTELVKREFRVPVIILTVHSEPAEVVGAFRAGAAAYVPKASAATELMTAIEHVTQGITYVSPLVARHVVSELMNRTHRPDPLTRRERQVLELIAQGKSLKETSAILGFAVTTCSLHRSRIMKKLDIREPSALVLHALRHGLVSNSTGRAGDVWPGRENRAIGAGAE